MCTSCACRVMAAPPRERDCEGTESGGGWPFGTLGMCVLLVSKPESEQDREIESTLHSTEAERTEMRHEVSVGAGRQNRRREELLTLTHTKEKREKER